MRTLFTFLLLSALLFSGQTIDAQIEAIQNAPVEKRFEMMNAFKREIVKMHEQERIEAIRKLKNVTKSRHGDRALKEIKRRERSISDKTKGRRHSHKSRTRAERSMTHIDHTGSAEARVHEHAQERIEDQIEFQTEMQIESQVECQIEEGVENAIENQLEDEHDDD